MYLNKIVDYKKQELEHQRRKVSLKDVRFKADAVAPGIDFFGALSRPGIRIIAEVKKASPSAGVIRADFNPLDIAKMYEESGASCLSVLTDEHFFQGSLSFLENIRKHVKLPLLRKDFTLDAYHLYEARAAGADAVLLIVRILEDSQLKDYSSLAEELGMEALIEVHEASEMERVVRIGSRLVGINNRNLDTFKVDLQTTIDLIPKATKNSVLVSESGISTREDIQKLSTEGVTSFLIGESLLREKNPGKKLEELLS